MRKALCCLLLCLCMFTGAAAEVQLLPQTAQWDPTLPIEVTLSADVTTHMPFDEERCAQLNALLSHVSLRIGTACDESQAYSRLAVCVDGREALRVTQAESAGNTQVQLSWQPYITLSGSGNVLNELLGQSGNDDMTLYGFDGSEAEWLDDGAEMMSSIGNQLEQFGKAAAIKTNIKDMGTARKKITYTIPKDQLEALVQAIRVSCPEGGLSVFLNEMVFSGQQKLILWLTAEGDVIRAEYAGKCGPSEAELRKVSLKWRMRRDDDLIRDSLTLKTPAVKGSDYNTVNCSRELTADEKGQVSYTLEFSEAVRAGSEKYTRTADLELLSTPRDNASWLSGSVTVKQQLSGNDTSASMVIEPEVLVGCDDGTPVVSGTVRVKALQGKAVLEEAAVAIEAGAGTYIEWQGTEQNRSLTEMTEQERLSITEGMAAALVPHLVLLPQEDTLYLSADLPEETWQQIVEAARRVLPEEVLQ